MMYKYYYYIARGSRIWLCQPFTALPRIRCLYLIERGYSLFVLRHDMSNKLAWKYCLKIFVNKFNTTCTLAITPITYTPFWFMNSAELQVVDGLWYKYNSLMSPYFLTLYLCNSWYLVMEYCIWYYCFRCWMGWFVTTENRHEFANKKLLWKVCYIVVIKCYQLWSVIVDRDHVSQPHQPVSSDGRHLPRRAFGVAGDQA